MSKLTSKKPIRPDFPVKEIQLDQIDLDLRNSRFPRDANDQIEALELMLKTAGNDCLEMFRDLTRTGRLNSSEIPIVVERNGRFVMMEGNRRLTCLRLWSDLTLLTHDLSLKQEYYSRFERLANESDYNPPSKLRVVVAPHEQDADIWIERKHASGAGGAGTVEWGAAMKDRRQARNDPTKTSRALAFVELVSDEYKDEPDVITALEEVRTKRYSFIKRFVDRSIVRELIGLEFSNGKMTLKYGKERSLPIIRKVIVDFARPKAQSGKTWARELDTAEDFKKYLERYQDLLPKGSDQHAHTNVNTSHPRKISDKSAPVLPEPNPMPTVKSPTSTGSHNPLHAESVSQSTPRPPRPTRAPEHILRGLKLNNFTPRIQEIVRQTSQLSVQRQNETVSVMLRVILDLTTYQFLKSHSKDVPRDLDKRIKISIKIIDPQASDALGPAETTSALRKAFHNTTPDSIRLTQYAVHDIQNGRTPAEILTLAARYTPLLSEMNNNMGDNPVQ